MSKRLFQVGNDYFTAKADAKAARGPYTPSGPTVAKGPDHWAFGVKKVGTTHSNSPVKKK